MTKSTPQKSSKPASPRRFPWRLLRLCFIVISFTCTIGAGVLWWKTTHIDQNGRLPKPTMAMVTPWGYFQATGMQDGLHCIGMRQSTRHGFSIQFERKTHLGNAGYHYGNQKTIGGFTFVLLTKTIHDYDVIQSPYAAVVAPYWFLIVGSACLLIYSTGIVQLLLLMCLQQIRAIHTGER